MRTICIETNPSAAIGWWIRYHQDDILYSTFSHTSKDIIRQHNLTRFQKEVIGLAPWDLSNILHEDNNIQIVSNTWMTKIPWLYHDPENHEILSKTWVVRMLSAYKLDRYLPKSWIIRQWEASDAQLYDTIKSHFPLWSRVVIKHAWIDGNGNWVAIIDYDSAWSIKEKIASAIEKFSKNIDGWKTNVFEYDFLIQEHISDILWEWSITFSIQNTRIENLGIANNVVEWGGYFGSTNVFPYINVHQVERLSMQLQKDLFPLLSQLQYEWVRWNIGFDMFFQNQAGEIKPYILECNGIHRMTGSLLPNNFAHNTKNRVFVGLPIAQKYLKKPYDGMGSQSLLALADILEWFWTKDGEAQIMNIKCEWRDRWYPVLWIASAWPSQAELFQLFYESKITNEMGTKYMKDIFKKMAGQ